MPALLSITRRHPKHCVWRMGKELLLDVVKTLEVCIKPRNAQFTEIGRHHNGFGNETAWNLQKSAMMDTDLTE